MIMARYFWRNDRFEDRDGVPMSVPARDGVPTPYVVSDISYISPITRKPITSRSERREELKRTNSREVDPSEFRPRYSDKKMAEAHRRDVEPAPVPDLSGDYQRLPADRRLK